MPLLTTIYKVRIYTRIIGALDKQIRVAPYQIETVRKLISDYFPSDYFEVTVIGNDSLTIFPATPSTQLWEYAEKPILIAFGEAANVVHKTKNYDRKLLIAPTAFPDRSVVDDYDREHTKCIFARSESGLRMARNYRRKCYLKVDRYNADEISLIDGIYGCGGFLRPKDYKRKKVVKAEYGTEKNENFGYTVFKQEIENGRVVCPNSTPITVKKQ